MLKRTIRISAMIGFFLVSLTSCERRDPTVKFEVSCNPDGFDVTYGEGGTTQQETASSGSWSESTNVESGDVVSIVAQAENKGASLTVEIHYDGDILDEASSSRDYAVAQASATIP